LLGDVTRCGVGCAPDGATIGHSATYRGFGDVAGRRRLPLTGSVSINKLQILHGICLFVCLFVCLSVCLSVCLPACLLPAYLFIYLFMYLVVVVVAAAAAVADIVQP